MDVRNQPVSKPLDLGHSRSPNGLRPQNFGTILRDLRFEAGLSQEALAERAALSVGGIGALERGLRRTPHLATVAKLTDALGLLPEEQARLEVAAARASRPRRRAVEAPVLSREFEPASEAAAPGNSVRIVIEVRQGPGAGVVISVLPGASTIEAPAKVRSTIANVSDEVVRVFVVEPASAQEAATR